LVAIENFSTNCHAEGEEPSLDVDRSNFVFKVSLSPAFIEEQFFAGLSKNAAKYYNLEMMEAVNNTSEVECTYVAP